MVDFQSRYRLYGHGYTSPDHRYPVATNKELYHEKAPKIFNRRPRAHDCRTETMKDFVDRREWEAWLLSTGLQDTYRSMTTLYNKPKETYSDGTKKEFKIQESVDTEEKNNDRPEKLLFNVGIRGKEDGDFNYPRGLTSTLDGNIIVADTMNHRIQIFNSFGVFIRKMGSRGVGKLQFTEPTDVTELTNGDIVVADKRNKRIQIVNHFGQFKQEIRTVNEPFSVASDSNNNIIVSTTMRTIEIYKRNGKLVNRFSIGGIARDNLGCKICVNQRSEILVCDALNGYIKYLSYDGKEVHRFVPDSTSEGLTIIPCGICVNRFGQVLIGDALNHTVNLYSERGVLIKQVICPSDQAGSVQTCAVGSEGHLITTEFSLSGPHSLKIFRYRACHCHITRPGSSKRRTPTPTGVGLSELS